jgi:tRNA_anti-like
MNKKLKIIIAIVTLIGILGFAGYNYVLYGGERNLDTEKADFTVTSTDITSEFTNDIDACNKKYLEKAVSISGTITSIKEKEITLDNSIICSLKNADKSLMKNQKITVKGRIVGYDDLMSELKLDQCFINK